jgi:DNA repair protein RadD
MFEVRWYQVEAINLLFDYFAHNPTGNPVIAIPGGTGKSFIIAKFNEIIMKRWPSQRILNLVNSELLVENNHKRFCDIYPKAPVGICCAGLGKKIASMQ